MPDEIDDIEEITRDETIEDELEEEELNELVADSDYEDLISEDDKGEVDECDDEKLPVKTKGVKKPGKKWKPGKKKVVGKVKKKVQKKLPNRKRLKLKPYQKAVIKHVKKQIKSKKEVKVKKSKPHKRGPKGAQWKNWTIPYQESSVMGKIFVLALKKGGIKIKDLEKLAKKAGANPARALKYLRSGHSKGWIWNVDDSHNRIRVFKPRIEDKSWKKK